MKRNQQTQRKNFCFTYNNYTPDGETALREFLTQETKYSIYGHEIAPTTGSGFPPVAPPAGGGKGIQ